MHSILTIIAQYDIINDMINIKIASVIIGLSSIILVPSLASAYVYNPNFLTTTADIFPPYISLVSISNVTTTGATLTWSTNEPATTQVETCLSYVRCGNVTPLVSTLTTQHVVNVTGLTPGTYYNLWPI